MAHRLQGYFLVARGTLNPSNFALDWRVTYKLEGRDRPSPPTCELFELLVKNSTAANVSNLIKGDFRASENFWVFKFKKVTLETFIGHFLQAVRLQIVGSSTYNLTSLQRELEL